MDRRKFNKGTKGNKGGRPTKAYKQKLVERLSPLEETAYKALELALKNGESWAVKMFFEYRYGKPTQLTHNINEDLTQKSFDGIIVWAGDD